MRKMKEMKKAAASVILAAAMVVSMTGCGGSDTKTETPETPAETTAQTPAETTEADTAQENSLIGSWEAKADMGLSDLLSGEEDEKTAGGEAMTKDVDPDEVKVTFVFTFNEDGTYTLEADQETWKTIWSSYMDNVKKGLKEYMTQLIEEEAQKADESVEDVAKQEGYDSVDEWIDAKIEEALESMNEVNTTVNDMHQEGRYEAVDGTLYINTDTSKDIDQEKDIYGTYQFQGDELVIDNGTDLDMIYHRR